MRDVWGVLECTGVYEGCMGVHGECGGDVCMHLTHLVHILIKGSLRFLITEGDVFRFLHCFCSLSINLTNVG